MYQLLDTERVTVTDVETGLENCCVLFICLLVDLFVCLFVDLFVCLLTHLFVCLLTYLFVS